MGYAPHTAKLALLASPLNWRRQKERLLPTFFLLTDKDRLPDPTDVLARLPRNAALVLRHTDSAKLESLARRLIPKAHRLGLKVLLAGDIRLALKVRADGVHLSEKCARRGPDRIILPPSDFIVTAAAHTRLSLWRAARAGAHGVFLSPAFPTQSHINTPAFGALRLLRLAKYSSIPVVALGGITHKNTRRLQPGPLITIAAIDGWRA